MNEQLKIIISAEIDKLKKGVDDAKKQVKGFKEQVKEASKNVDDNIKKMGQGLANGFKAVGTTLAATGAALLALGASTQEYRTEQAKLATAFETAGASADTAKGVYNDLYRTLGDSGVAVEAANHLAKLTTNQQDLSEWTNICQGVFATFGDSLPIEGLTEAANETAKVGTVTGSLADALNWAGVSEDAFNESLAACNTEAEREALIRETLTGLYSDAASKYEETAADVLAQNEANAKLQETMAALGEAVAPVVTAFTTFASEALAVVVPYIQQLAENYMPVLQAALEAVASALGTTFEFISQHWEILLGMAAVIGGITVAIGLYNAVAAVKAAMDAAQVTTLWALVSAYAAQAVAVIAAIAPYVLIVAAIAAVIAIIVLCIKHWDDIKKKIAEVWENIKQKTTEAVEKVKAKFEDMKARASEKVEALKQAVVDKFNQVKQNIQDKINGAKEAVSTAFNNMKSTAISIVSNIVSSVKGKFDEIKNGIKEKIDGAKEAVKSAIDAIKGFFNFSWSLPHLKMPHITISGSFSINPPSAPRFGISWYAQGGVFDSPHLFPWAGGIGGLGEDGAEAIVPLEKNTQWLDKIAERLAAKDGGKVIVMQVDGKTFAQVSVDSINALTKQTGSLPLRLA